MSGNPPPLRFLCVAVAGGQQVTLASLYPDAQSALASVKAEYRTGPPYTWYVFDLTALRGRCYRAPTLAEIPDPTEIPPP